jgi:hypothetical protein
LIHWFIRTALHCPLASPKGFCRIRP